ncbi:MAG: hypothetical protein RLZ98_3415 [Pseudomonadota bacterium]|jgi:Undecaprenyl-phosphate glucose phosphotransferase
MANAEFSTGDRAGVLMRSHGSLPRLADFRTTDSTRLISHDVLAGLVKLGEFAMLAALGIAIAVAYVPQQHYFASYLYPAASIGTAFVAVALMDIMGIYRTKTVTRSILHVPTAVTAWMIALGLLVAVIFFFKASSSISRVWLLSWFLAGSGGLIASRCLLSMLMRKWARQRRLNKRAVVYGAGAEGEVVLRALEGDLETDIRICGVFDDRNSPRSPGLTFGYPRLGNLNELLRFVRKTRVDLVILSLPLAAEKRLVGMLDTLSVLPVDIRLAGPTSQLHFNPRAYSYIGNVAMLDLADKPIKDWGSMAKSLFDRVVAFAALVALAPLMAVVAAAIRLDSKGPVLFKQKRYGFNNKLIEIYKFRSMYTDMADAQAAKLVTKDDPRVTPVGRFIRKTSIDELPQLFNVLTGQLSLVGPRPHALQAKAADKLYDQAVSNYFARHKVKPGITGWAQINGWRGETDTEEKLRRRVEHDLYYIDNWSLFFDIYILIKTPLALLKTDSAY